MMRIRKTVLLLLACWLSTSKTFAQDTCSVLLPGGGGYYGNEQYDTCYVNWLQKIRIPVIFHVVYRNNKENIETHLLKKELDDLHKDFLHLNADSNEVLSRYQHLVCNAIIDFYLAQEKFDGSDEGGIIRVKRNQLEKPETVSAIIEPEKYLNIYVYTRHHNGAHTPPVPWTTPYKDAVFVSYVEIGQGYRILTHEVGHWLGLLHTYESKNCTDAGDGLVDTPQQLQSADGGFVIKKNDPSLFPTNCAGDPCLYQNFMDYSFFRCMFTRDQVKRMRIIIANKRKQLMMNNP